MALNTRSNLAHLSTLTPKGGKTLAYMRMTSMILKRTTKLSKRLKSDTKYPCSPKLYIFSNISRVKRMTKNKLAIAAIHKIKYHIRCTTLINNLTAEVTEIFTKNFKK